MWYPSAQAFRNIVGSYLRDGLSKKDAYEAAYCCVARQKRSAAKIAAAPLASVGALRSAENRPSDHPIMTPDLSSRPTRQPGDT
jgi:hypothetical protein